MESGQIRLTAVTAFLAISLTLSACGPQPSGSGAPASETAPAITTAETGDATLSASPAPTAAETPSVPTPAGPSTPTETPPPPVPAQAALKVFTFPDRHVSFSYPGDWTVKTETHPRNPIYEEAKNDTYFALVSDSAGNELVSIKTGLYGVGCAGGLADRTNFDVAHVQGLKVDNGGDVVLGFARQVYPFNNPDYYEMGLSRPENFPEGKGVSSGCILVTLPNGGLIASVIFSDPAFPGPEAARAWMATEQYSQIRALLLSLTYA